MTTLIASQLKNWFCCSRCPLRMILFKAVVTGAALTALSTLAGMPL